MPDRPTCAIPSPPAVGRAAGGFGLFAVSVVSVLRAASIGLAAFRAKRLLNLDPPDVVRTFVNYVAGVKLYNQKSRKGGGLPAENADFLDSMDEPPRVSIRRRMVRALALAALADYDHWYVVAHSLGTVVAFNGLMESSYAWPDYFDEKGWNELVGRLLTGRRHLTGLGAGPRWFPFSNRPAGTVPTPLPAPTVTAIGRSALAAGGSARSCSRRCWGGLTLPPIVRLVGATAASAYREAASALRPRDAAHVRAGREGG